MVDFKRSSAMKGNKNAAKGGFKSAAKTAAMKGLSATNAALNKRPMLKAGLMGVGIATAAVGKGVALANTLQASKSPAEKLSGAIKRSVKKAVKAVKSAKPG